MLSIRPTYCWYVITIKTQSVKSRKESYISINTKELDRVLSIKCLSYR